MVNGLQHITFLHTDTHPHKRSTKAIAPHIATHDARDSKGFHIIIPHKVCPKIALRDSEKAFPCESQKCDYISFLPNFYLVCPHPPSPSLCSLSLLSLPPTLSIHSKHVVIISPFSIHHQNILQLNCRVDALAWDTPPRVPSQAPLQALPLSPL